MTTQLLLVQALNGLLERHAAAIAECIGPVDEVVEFGAGAVRKVRLLLNALPGRLRYLPVDALDEEFLLTEDLSAYKVNRNGSKA